MKGIEKFQDMVKKDRKNPYLSLEKAKLLFQNIMRIVKRNNTYKEDSL